MRILTDAWLRHGVARRDGIWIASKKKENNERIDDNIAFAVKSTSDKRLDGHLNDKSPLYASTFFVWNNDRAALTQIETYAGGSILCVTYSTRIEFVRWLWLCFYGRCFVDA